MKSQHQKILFLIMQRYSEWKCGAGNDQNIKVSNWLSSICVARDGVCKPSKTWNITKTKVVENCTVVKLIYKSEIKRQRWCFENKNWEMTLDVCLSRSTHRWNLHLKHAVWLLSSLPRTVFCTPRASVQLLLHPEYLNQLTANIKEQK